MCTQTFKRAMVAVSLVAVLGTAPGMARAGTEFDFSTLWNGTPVPSGTPPWAKVVFENAGSNTVTMVFTSLLDTAAAPSGSYIQDLELNLDPALSAASLTFSSPTVVNGSFNNATISKDNNTIHHDGAGFFDIHLGFDTSNPSGNVPSLTRFDNSDAVQYTLTYSGSGTFDENSFSFLSQASPDPPKPQYASISVAGWNNLGQSGDYAPVPEPVHYQLGVLLTLGGIGFMTMRKRK